MLLDDQDAPRLGDGRHDRLFVDRLDRVHVEDAHADVVLVFEQLGGLGGVVDGDAAGDDGDIGALVDHHRLADLEAVVVVLVVGGLEAPAQTDVHGAGALHRGAHGVGRLPAVGRNDHAHVGERALDGDVLGAVVRGAGLTEADAAVRGDDLDVEVLVADVGAYLLEGAHAGERRHRAHERQQAALGHAGGDAEEVLLGDADVEHALRELVLEDADLGAARQIGRQRHDARVGLGQVAEDAPVDLGLRQRVGVVDVPGGAGDLGHDAPPAAALAGAPVIDALALAASSESRLP